jgi:hypothetical protein
MMFEREAPLVVVEDLVKTYDDRVILDRSSISGGTTGSARGCRPTTP